MKSKVLIDVAGDVDRIYDRFQLENFLRELEQQETARQAQNQLLEVDDYREFRRRRADESSLVVEPNIPLDEMTFQDFKRTRAHQQDSVRQPQLEIGELSYRDYRIQRERDLRRKR